MPSHHCYQVALDSECESLTGLWEHSFTDTDCKLHLVAAPLGSLHLLLQPALAHAGGKVGARLCFTATCSAHSSPGLPQWCKVPCPTLPLGSQDLDMKLETGWARLARFKGRRLAEEPLRILLHRSHCASVKGASLSSPRLMASSRTSSIDKIN